MKHSIQRSLAGSDHNRTIGRARYGIKCAASVSVHFKALKIVKPCEDI